MFNNALAELNAAHSEFENDNSIANFYALQKAMENYSYLLPKQAIADNSENE